MIGIFKSIGSLFKSIGLGIALPFTKVKSSSQAVAVVRWSFHFTCLAGVTVGLAFLNYSMQLDTMLRTPAAWLRAAWLPLLALQLYLISWIGWWLCRAILSKHRNGDFPELEKAWKKFESKLQQSGLDFTRTPVFLVLGQPSDSTRSLFEAGMFNSTLPVFPNDPDSPFSAQASEDAIYLCCEQTSLIGKQSALLHCAARQQKRQTGRLQLDPDQRGAHDFSTASNFSSEYRSADGERIHDGLALPSAALDDTGSFALAVAEKSTTETQTPAQATLSLIESNIALFEETEPDVYASLDTKSEPATYQSATPKTVPILQNELEIESTIARLVYLCELINEARKPYCPINGVVVLVPFSTTESEALANHTGMLIEQDLQAIRDTLMVEAPRIAVICDIHQIEGCSDLINRFPKQQRHRRLGIKFPLVPPCDRDRVSEMIVNGLDWMCLKMIPPLVNRLFMTEDDSRENVIGAGNQRIYQFAQAIRGRQKRLERLMRRAFMCQTGSNGRLRGCYLAATGFGSRSEQGFTAGIFSQVTEMQNDVVWTDRAIQRDKDFRRWALFGYVGVFSVALTTLICILL